VDNKGIEIKEEVNKTHLPTDVKEFIRLLKSLDERRQIGLYLITEGIQVIKQ